MNGEERGGITMTFKEIIRFHGHRCPGLAMGYRMSCDAMEALKSMRAEDEELVAIVENDACGVAVMESRILEIDGKTICIPCHESKKIT